MNISIKFSIEEKIKKYEKNTAVVCDILTFYKNLDEEEISIESYTLLDKVIKDLEDKEVNVPFKANSIEYLLANNQDEYNDLKKLCQAYGIDREIKKDFRLSLIEKYYIESSKSKKRYNFLEKVYKTSKDFINEFLISDIPLSQKIDFFYDTILFISKEGSGPGQLENILAPKPNSCELNRTSPQIKDQEIKILIKAFHDYLNKKNMKKSELFLQLLKNKVWVNDWICYLQNHKIVDFTDLEGQIKLFGHKINCSSCAYLDLTQPNFMNFYASADYCHRVSQELRTNDDLYILDKIKINNLTEFIALENFVITTEKIQKIANRVLNYQKENKKNDIDLINNIRDAIIYKSKSNKEYRQMSLYANLFVKLSDYAQYKQEEEIKKQELLQARFNLVLRLANLNESLQEQVPQRTLLKNISSSSK